MSTDRDQVIHEDSRHVSEEHGPVRQSRSCSDGQDQFAIVPSSWRQSDTRDDLHHQELPASVASPGVAVTSIGTVTDLSSELGNPLARKTHAVEASFGEPAIRKAWSSGQRIHREQDPSESQLVAPLRRTLGQR